MIEADCIRLSNRNVGKSWPIVADQYEFHGTGKKMQKFWILDAKGA